MDSAWNFIGVVATIVAIAFVVNLAVPIEPAKTAVDPQILDEDPF